MTQVELAAQPIDALEEETRLALRDDDRALIPPPVPNESVAEIVARMDRDRTLAADPYVGVSALPFDERAQQVLTKYQEVPDEWIDIRPEGLIYLSHIKARRILNEAFGFGGWAIVPVGPFRSEENGNHVILYRTFRLYVNGRFVGEVEASGDYWTNNSSQNKADAAEACQSYALNRLSKNFGIASQCWDKAYGETWKAKYAEQRRNDRTGKMEWYKKIGRQAPQSGPRERSTESPEAQLGPELSHSSPRSSSAPNTPVIQIASAGKSWTYRGVANQMFKDTSGKSWKFVGDAINVAVQSGGAPVRVEVVREKTDKGFVSAVVAAQIIEEGGHSAQEA